MSDPHHPGQQGVTPTATTTPGSHGVTSSPTEHGHGHGHEHAASPFSEAEMSEFRKSDIGAGGAVVVLMSAIFSIGLVLYTVIAFVTY